ncbi:PadR family transcriptional regulator [Rhodococcus erythropolis]|uniref:PadR family transcriptional regulator n=1 Tax=Rhodococcus erythropolis TaxID=1833 RepID=UPI0027E22788|nr:PadR family transcriptional regulator [Rhodococcus erythropolis]
MWVPTDDGTPDDAPRDHDGGRRGRPHERPGFGDMPRRGHRRGRFGPDGGPGFGPGAQFGRGRGRGGRGRRGDVRAAILLLIAEEPMHGYELIQQIVERSGGVWKPSPGSIYPALSQLEDEGLVIIEKVAGRKTAKLTEEGVAYVEEHRADLGAPWDDVRLSVGEPEQDLRELIGQLMGAAGQVAAVGTPAQVKAAADVLVEARKSLYRVLAGDDAGEGGN